MACDAPCPSIPAIAPNQTRILRPRFVKRFNEQEMPPALMTHLLVASLQAGPSPWPAFGAQSPGGSLAPRLTWWDRSKVGRPGRGRSCSLRTDPNPLQAEGEGGAWLSLRLLRSLPLAPEPADLGLQRSALLPVRGEPGMVQMEG